MFEEASTLAGVDGPRRRVLTQMAAERGCRCARAVCLTRGWWVEGGKEEGFALLQKVAHEEQCAEAKFNLASCYANGAGVAQDWSKAVEWCTKAAEQGHAWAQNDLGFWYENGIGVAQDRSKAAEWYTKAAEQGNSIAQDNLLRVLKARA